MKRTPLERRTPLRADPEKARAWERRSRKPLPREGRRAKRLRRLGLIDEAYRAWIRRAHCLGCAAWPSEAAHVRRRWNGWHDWLPDGAGNLVPLCKCCHNLADGRVPNHGGRRQFEEDTGLELATAAAELGERYKRTGASGSARMAAGEGPAAWPRFT